VIKALRNIEGEIIVVDNYSTDDSASFFKDRFQEVQFIWNTVNTGFAKANNQALELASGEYILFLNPDTIVPEDCFEKCIFFIQSQKNECASGIRMIDGAGNFLKESKRAFPSPSTSLYKLSGLAKMFKHSKKFTRYHLGYLNEHENHKVDVLAGAFMMIPRKILQRVGGFDEDFFMYGEDIELSYRIKKAGFSNWYFSESSIIHFKGESTKKGSLNYVKMFYKAMGTFVKKHYAGKEARFYRFLIFIGIFLRAGLSAFRRVFERISLPLAKITVRFFRSSVFLNKNRNDPQTVIVGSIDEYNNIVNLLKNAGKNLHIAGRIKTDAETTKDTMGSFNDIEMILKNLSVKKIIFCEGSLSFKEIIETMPRISKKTQIQLFARGSHAIIGSNDKDTSGDLIAETVNDRAGDSLEASHNFMRRF
jgi:GT2 family glycosyltransferase